jgi:hypothetical protein
MEPGIPQFSGTNGRRGDDAVLKGVYIKCSTVLPRAFAAVVAIGKAEAADRGLGAYLFTPPPGGAPNATMAEGAQIGHLMRLV